MNNKFIAYCGLDCEKCEAYIATQKDDDALREKVAKEWSELNNLDLAPESINCDGCRMDGIKTVFCDSFCKIKKCAEKKGYSLCSKCDGFESCEELQMIISNNKEALNNLNKNK